MNNNYDKAFEFIMKWEGYKSNDPDDSGGRTIWGISEGSHPEVVVRLWDLPKAESRREAKIFYKTEYWDKCDCDLFHGSNTAIFIFDIAVNMGIDKAIDFANSLYKNLFDLFIMRIKEYVRISKKGNNIKYLRGWLNRVIDLWEYLK